MTELIEPNLHPIVVHFVIAFLATAPVLLLISSVSPGDAKAKGTLQAAGDWMLALGAVFAALAVAAGLQAYYTVAHDAPSHAAMTDHRNFALTTAGLFLALAIWRFIHRQKAPSLVFAVVLFAAAGLLGVTGWKGAHLVYHYGLGVTSLPAAEGPGHQHDHGAPHEHDDGAAAHEEDDHDHDADHDADHDHAADDHHDDTTSDDALAPAAGFSSLSPEGVAEAFAAALRAGDDETIRALLAPDAVIAEGGGAERSLEEYAGHHMPADMEFTAAVEASVKNRDVIASGDMATVITESTLHGSFKGKPVHAQMMETMVLRRAEDGWRIKHIHWSSAPITGEHEH